MDDDHQSQWDSKRASVLLYHDLSPDPNNVLKELFKNVRRSRQLESLLLDLDRALRNEYALLEKHDLGRVANFLSLRQLAREAGNGHTADIVTRVVLSVAAQLCCSYFLLEQKPALLTHCEPRPTFAGLCTGVIVAAGTAAATSVQNFLRLAPTLIRVAFRLAICADRRAREIDPSQESWALVLTSISGEVAKAIIDRLKQLSLYRRPYISAESPSSVTISGPPPTLKALACHALFEYKALSLPIAAPFHAAHLPCPDIDYITDFAGLDGFSFTPCAKLISAQGEDMYCAQSLRSALRGLARDVFQSRMSLLASNSPFSGDQRELTITSVKPAGSWPKMWLKQDSEYCVAPVDLKLAPDTVLEDDVAIIGMAGRFPQADSLEEFWDIIASGKDVHQLVSLESIAASYSLTSSQIPQDRFNAKKFYDKTAAGKNTTSTLYGCFMKHPELFDNNFFNISPREAKQIDPQHRILLMVTQEALQMAGYSSSGKKRIGTFFGQATDDWRESHTRQDIDIFYIGSGMRAFAPGRLNYHYKWDGPSYNIDTACSSSLAALEMAYKAVLSGDCDLAVAGGGNLCTALPMFSGLSKGKFTSSTGSCKTFCATADGYCRGEAVGVVVIQRADEAIRENSSIKGIISGIRTNHSAFASSITHPHAGHQSDLMVDTLDKAGLCPEDIDYVEFHGTGTQAGDKTEIESVSQTFCSGQERHHPLYIGAVKANVGHGEAAAGITSLIKSLLMLQHHTIPPHCGVKEGISPFVAPFVGGALQIPEKSRSFENLGRPVNIMINNFNATGGNTSMILSEFVTKRLEQNRDPRSHHPVVVSAHTAKALQANLVNLHKYLTLNLVTRIWDLSYSTTSRRNHFKIRASFVAENSASLTTSIGSRIAHSQPTIDSRKKRIIFAFAGQGTHKQGIVKELYATSKPFRKILQRHEAVCRQMGFPRFVSLLTDVSDGEPPTSLQLHLATVAIELSLAQLWQSWGIQPDGVIGHSIGEYVALCIAGVISSSDMFNLVGERAQLIQDLCSAKTHAMLAIQQAPEDAAFLLSDERFLGCEISCLNGHTAVTIGGPLTSLQQLEGYLSEQKIRAKLIPVDHAFHSEHVDPILDGYEKFAQSIPFSSPRIPVYSTLLGLEVTQSDVFNASYLRRHTREPVQFIEALQAATIDTSNENIWVEFGPGDAMCLPLVRSTVSKEQQGIAVATLNSKRPVWEVISSGLSAIYEKGGDVNWRSYHESFEQELQPLDLPSYAFDLKPFWIPLDDSPDTSLETNRGEKLTPLLHNLIKSYDQGGFVSAVFESKLSDPRLLNTIRGHKVLNVALCPSSVYSILATDAVAHLRKTSIDVNAYEIRDMSIRRPLVANEKSGKLSTTATQTPRGVSISFASESENGSTVRHAECLVITADTQVWRRQWLQIEFLAHERMRTLRESQGPHVLRLSRNVLYKLFSHIVDYGEAFRGIQQIVLDSNINEAAATIQFADTKFDKTDSSVHLVDSLMHFAGFVLNNGIQDQSHAFISDGWEGLQITPGLEGNHPLQYYTRLSSNEKQQVYSGDVYAFSNGRIVASCIGVRFQRMKMQHLKIALRPQQSSSESHAVVSNPESEWSVKKTLRVSEKHDNGNISNLSKQLKEIVAQECGLDVRAVTDGSNLQDLGLDSILMMTILDKVNETFGYHISAQDVSAIETYAELLAKIQSQQEKLKKQSATQKVASQYNPQLVQQVTEHIVSSKKQDQSALIDLTLSVIAESVEVSKEQVLRADEFSALGIDSLLSIDIIDTIQQRTGAELPSSFLSENTNMEKVRAALSRRPAVNDSGYGSPIAD